MLSYPVSVDLGPDLLFTWLTETFDKLWGVLIRLILIIFVNFFLFLWDLGVPTAPYFATVTPLKLLIFLQALFLLIWSFKHFHYFYGLRLSGESMLVASINLWLQVWITLHQLIN